MTPGTAISATAHALILAWGLFTFSARPLDVAPVDSVMADVISESEFSRLTAGMKTAAPSEKPQPVADKLGEAQPPPKDMTAKASDKPEIQASAPEPAAAAPPPPPPPQPPDAKPHAGPPPAASEAKPEPKKPEPDPIAEALKKEEVKRKEEAKKQEEAKKREDEAKKREEAKRREEAKKREEAKREEEAKKRDEPKFDFDRIQTALLDKRTPQRPMVTGSMVNPTPTLGASLANAPVLSQNEIDALRAQLYSCWNPPVGVLEAKDLVVTIRFSLNRDGSLSGEPAVTNHTSHPLFQIASESALRAVRRCQPFRLPVVKYDAWQEVEVSFRPEDMFPR
jgi:colicin import membrane protein